MKVFKIHLGSEQTKTVWTEGEHVVDVNLCIPNEWNPNVMDRRVYDKTKLGVRETMQETSKLPPIVVRPLLGDKHKLQIIDGYHRWRMHKEDGLQSINVYVIYVSTKRAMLMTAQLNYNRGEPDMEKYPQYLSKMIELFGDVDAKYLSERLTDSEDEIRSYLDNIGFAIERLPELDDEDEEPSSDSGGDASDADALLELKFMLRRGAAEVVERELVRLTSALGGGSNVRGRALEVMAVLSSQTPDDSIGAVSDVTPIKRKRKRHANG